MKNILIVDDYKTIRLLIKDMLECIMMKYDDYEIDEASNGLVALALIKEIDYDLITLDVQMIGMTGIELYNIILSEHKNLKNKVIFITSDCDFVSEYFTKKSISINCIEKPINTDKFESLVNSIINK